MSNSRFGFLIAGIALLGLTGCVAPGGDYGSPYSSYGANTTPTVPCPGSGTNTLIGAGSGAVVGGLIGNSAGGRRHSTGRTIGGALIGGLAGGLIGSATEQRCAAVVAQPSYNYRPAYPQTYNPNYGNYPAVPYSNNNYSTYGYSSNQNVYVQPSYPSYPTYSSPRYVNPAYNSGYPSGYGY